MDIASSVKCLHQLGVPLVSYTQANCPRCNGTGFYYGVAFGSDGNIQTVTSANELMQQLQKILICKRKPSGYGFDYSIMTKVTSTTVDAVKVEVQRCILYLQSIQQKSIQQGYYIPTTGKIATIYYLTAVRDSVEPRQINIAIGIMTQSGQRLSPMLLSLQNKPGK